MELVLEERARGVARDAAIAWWFDFQEGHSDHAFAPGFRRLILGESNGRVTMEDKSPYWREVTTAWRDGDAVKFEGTNPVSRFSGAYSFVDDGEGGTLVRLVAVIELKPALRAGALLAGPVARGILRADLRHHVREMVEDTAPKRE